MITLKFSEDTLFRYLSIFNLYVEYGERFFLNLFFSNTDKELENINYFIFVLLILLINFICDL